MGKVKDTATKWPAIPHNQATPITHNFLVASNPTSIIASPSPAILPAEKSVAELAKIWGKQNDTNSFQGVPPTILAPVFSLNSPVDGLSFSTDPEEDLTTPLDTFDGEFLSTPSSIPTPPPQPPTNSKSHLPPPLYPLTPGGFLYYPEQSVGPNNQSSAPAFGLSHVDPEIEFPNFVSTLTKVSPDIASRQDKLEKYRQKRTKRNWEEKSKNTARQERAQVFSPSKLKI